MGQPTAYTYPKVEDYRVLFLTAGRGCFMWKRDLARYFLQLPMDYSKVGVVSSSSSLVWLLDLDTQG